MSQAQPTYFLREAELREFVAELDWTHSQAADHLGLSRSYWSQLINGRRALSPAVRVRLMQSPQFSKLGRDGLWARRTGADPTGADQDSAE